MTNKIRLHDLFRYYKHGLAHQMAAVTELEEAINRANPHILGRDQRWFKTWSTAGKQHDYSAGIALIKEFEGCHLEAYADPLHGWDVPTIGYGITRYGDGRKVQRGDKITSVEADTLLRLEVDRIGKRLSETIPHWGDMSDKQKGALLSFAFNLGPAFYGAAGFATISRVLRERAWREVPAALELYRNPGSNVEAGLLRRRRAEGKLWQEGLVGQPTQQVTPSHGNPLQVPWYSQLDSDTDQARRMCFSSSCAMLLEYLKPGTLKGPNGDDQYLRRVQQYGDTTSSAAQVRALSSFGIKARFVTNASFATLEQQIAKGVPTPCGYLHRGPVSAPAGGGHYLIVVGHTPDTVIVHDPLGEADLINGTTLNKPARFAHYSRKNFGPRWCVEGPGTGWAILAER